MESVTAYVFSIFFFLNGTWVLGDTMDGWGSMVYETEALCEERVEAANAFYKLELKQYPDAKRRVFVCTPVEIMPPSSPPE